MRGEMGSLVGLIGAALREWVGLWRSIRFGVDAKDLDWGDIGGVFFEAEFWGCQGEVF